jgi:hypothetical protein
MSILPSSFSANKIGYKQYLKQGGSLDFSDFKVYERRTALEILKENDDRLYSAMMNHYDMAIMYRNKGEQDMYELHMLSCDIRAKQHSELYK